MDFLNVIVENGNIQDGDEELLFGPMEHECSGCSFCRKQDVMRVLPSTNMIDLLMEIGAFKSRGQAKKNWKNSIDIPSGWSEFFIGKVKRHLCIWKPSN